MQVSISDPVFQTVLFSIILGVVFLLTYRKKENYSSFSLTQELKGFAILTIIFAHIGYYLASDTRFLFPLSVLAGVGVNLFFFLSGFGLSLSQMKKHERPLHFYKRKLPKLFIPLWIVLALLFLLDLLFYGLTYGKLYVLKAFFGIFTHANLYADVNAPLWYFSLILIYYILFPICFNKKNLWLSALLLYLAVWALVRFNFPALWGIIGLYQVHMAAFPIGVLAAWILTSQKRAITWLRSQYVRVNMVTHVLFVSLLLLSISYLAIHSNVGNLAYLEEETSIYTMLAVLVLFFIKKREVKLFSLFGFYSYEIYLFHWPLLYRYDIIYKHLPASLATLVYLGLFIVGAELLRRTTLLISQRVQLVRK